jgi:hypothetical protein
MVLQTPLHMAGLFLAETVLMHPSAGITNRRTATGCPPPVSHCLQPLR